MTRPDDTAALARQIGATLDGAARPFTGLASPATGGAGRIVVAADPATLDLVLTAPGAADLAAIVVPEGTQLERPHPPLLHHPQPRLALARISALVAPEDAPIPGVHPSAVVDPSAQVHADVEVGPTVVIGPRTQVGPGSVLAAGVVLGADVQVGAAARIFANAVLYPGVKLGARVRIHAGAVLGADGFGYAEGPEGAEKIHHLGGVVVDDDVEIGANSTIDRGTLDDTRIGAGTRIDNQCVLGHNVQVGRGCLLAGHVAVGGSTRLGDRVQVGGGSRLSDHLTVGDDAILVGGSTFHRDVPAGERWGGYPAAPVRVYMRERYLIGKLERIWEQVRRSDRDPTRTREA